MSNDLTFSFPIEALTDRIVERVLEKLSEQQAPVEERLITTDEACQIFIPKISRATLIKWAKDYPNLIKAYRIGDGRSYYKRSEILSSARELKKYEKPG
jgi:hypothetical protein